MYVYSLQHVVNDYEMSRAWISKKKVYYTYFHKSIKNKILEIKYSGMETFEENM